LFVTASGTYAPTPGGNGTLPVKVDVSIAEGLISLWGLGIPLPIQGTGQFTILFTDGRVRIFESSGRIAVQVRADLV
jgi:hypothetical protein